jgi:DNA invertase Pin-like site-specific DNA recombinase
LVTICCADGSLAVRLTLARQGSAASIRAAVGLVSGGPLPLPFDTRAGVDLYLDRQGVDTSTPAGKALFQMLGVFAEFERSIIQERIAAGIARARVKGTRSGKAFGRPKLTAEREAAVRAALAEGMGIRRAARLVGTGNATVARIAAEVRAEALRGRG